MKHHRCSQTPRPVNHLDSRTTPPHAHPECGGTGGLESTTGESALACTLQPQPGEPRHAPPAPAPSRVFYLVAFPWGTPDVVGGSRCLIHVRRKLGGPILGLQNFLRAWRVARCASRGGQVGPPSPATTGRAEAGSSRRRFQRGSSPRDDSPQPGAEEGEAAAGTPEGARAAAAASRALCPALPSWETVQTLRTRSPSKSERSSEEGPRRYVYEGVAGVGLVSSPSKGWGHRRSSGAPRPNAPRAEPRLQDTHGFALHSRMDLSTALHTLKGSGWSRHQRRAGTPLALQRVIRKGNSEGRAPALAGSSCARLRARNLPGMVGRWHARLCQAPLHREGEDVEGAEEELDGPCLLGRVPSSHS